MLHCDMSEAIFIYFKSANKMGDTEGVTILAEALRRQRLASAELEWRYNTRVESLVRELREVESQKQRLAREAAAQKQRADALEKGTSTRWRLQERKDWMQQVQNITKDRDRLKRENEALVAKLEASDDAHGLAGAVREAVLKGDGDRDSPEKAKFLGPEEGVGDAAEWMKLVNELQAELQSSRGELQNARASIDALRLKLNIELERKFELEHQPPSLLVRLYDEFEYIVAPPAKSMVVRRASESKVGGDGTEDE